MNWKIWMTTRTEAHLKRTEVSPSAKPMTLCLLAIKWQFVGLSAPNLVPFPPKDYSLCVGLTALSCYTQISNLILSWIKIRALSFSHFERVELEGARENGQTDIILGFSLSAWMERSVCVYVQFLLLMFSGGIHLPATAAGSAWCSLSQSVCVHLASQPKGVETQPRRH